MGIRRSLFEEQSPSAREWLCGRKMELSHPEPLMPVPFGEAFARTALSDIWKQTVISENGGSSKRSLQPGIRGRNIHVGVGKPWIWPPCEAAERGGRKPLHVCPPDFFICKMKALE